LYILETLKRKRRSFYPIALGSIVVLAGACAAPPPSAEEQELIDLSATYGDDLTVVDCLLPGKVRRMGRSIVRVTRPRPVKALASDCAIRGGQYVAFDRANYDTALKIWQDSANAGDPTAQTYVGEIHERGLGRTPDYALAAVWYRKAAEQGFPRAQMKLGALYERGLGVPKDSVKAINWYRKSSGLDDSLEYSSSIQALRRSQSRLRSKLQRTESKLEAARKVRQSTEEELRRVKNLRRQSGTSRSTAEPTAIRAQEQRLSDQLSQLSTVFDESELTSLRSVQAQGTVSGDDSAASVRAQERRLSDQLVELARLMEQEEIAQASLEGMLSVSASS
jgi:hypothetical protein